MNTHNKAKSKVKVSKKAEKTPGKDKGGRPRKYNESELFSQKVDEYFIHCDNELKKDNEGKTYYFKPYTITGLCVYLNICRDTLSEYAKDERFSDTIKKAKDKVENYIEENSLIGKLNPTVSIFNLKNNFGWKDSQEIKHSGLKPLEITVDSEDKKKKIDEL
jgi:hypothetical protein